MQGAREPRSETFVVHRRISQGQNRRAAEREVSARLSPRSTNGGEERFGGDEIGGGEPLGEAAVDGGQQLARLAHSLLSAPESGEARSGPQFPGESALASRYVECLMKALLGRRDRGRFSPQEKQFPLRAE